MLRGRSREQTAFPYMVAKRGPLVKAQLSHTHAFCSHALDKKQKHLGWSVKEGLRNAISVKEHLSNFSHTKNPSAMGNGKDIVKNLTRSDSY